MSFDLVVIVIVIITGALVFVFELHIAWKNRVLLGTDGDVELPEIARRPPPVQAATGRLTVGDEVVFDTFNQERAEEEGGGCAICLVEYKDSETLATITVCKHRYHVFCIRAWLKDHDTCPLCRTQV
ncbi:hypothetical protein MIMGU_mgv1a016311mg [Erythranthe guttata]|uniref:RING-type domain-containing protein n=1 Tax=Erythranthe guttata TaxID=4155 RepID=A0A022PTY9_ERYGU|nr:hypothetical protein MIMGU_mgv1a016311mg [Erythranthe guttata]